jgi:hypothetical protein
MNETVDLKNYLSLKSKSITVHVYFHPIQVTNFVCNVNQLYLTSNFQSDRNPRFRLKVNILYTKVPFSLYHLPRAR